MQLKLSFKLTWLTRYAAACFAVGVGLLVRAGLTAWVGPGLPTYVTFYPAVMLAALLAGVGPGLVATFAAALVADYWVILPEGFGISEPVDAVGMAFFLCMGVFMSGVAEYLRRARQKAAAYDREEALRETRQQKQFLADVIEQSSQPFGVGYPDGRLGLVNHAFEQLTGYTADELRGIDWANALTAPEWREIEQQKLGELRRTGQPVRYQKEYIRKDGSRVPIELLVHLVRDEEGRPKHYYSFLTDITERRQADVAIREMNIRLEQRVAEQTAEIRQANETLEQRVAARTAELQTANEALAASRRASLSLVEDAVEARKEAERINEELQSTNQSLHSSRTAALNLMEDAVKARKQTEERSAEVARLNRTLKAITKSGQVMLRATDESDYLKEVCRIIVEDCGHAMVWAGLAEDDEAKSVRPVAHAGLEEGYLETLNITWADTERGRGPTGTAIRTGKPSLCRNMLTDPKFAPWREDAIKRGYASSLVLPLLADGRAFAALNIYSQQPNGITDADAKLLTELADDLAYGITAIRLRAAKADAELEREKFISLADNSAEFIGMFGLDFIPFYVNGAGRALLGLDSLEAACRVPVRDFFFPEDQPFILNEFLPRVLREGRAEVEIQFRHFKTGQAVWMIYNVFYVRDAQGNPVGLATVSRNISERRRAEQRADLLAGTASRLLSTDSPQAVVEELCRQIMAFLDCQFFFNFLVDERAGRLHLNACAGVPAAQVREIEWLDYDTAVCGCAARDACRIIAQDIQHTPDPRTELVKSYGVQAYACHPLMVEDRVLGTLSFGTSSRARFTDAEIALMKAVADQVAIAMDRQRNQEELRKVNAELEQRVIQRTTEFRESEARYRSLVTASAQVVWLTDVAGKVVVEMPTWQSFTGHTFEQYKGSGWVESLHPDDRLRALEVWSRAVSTRTLYETEYRLLRHDGQYRVVAARGVPVLGESGSIREWVGTCTDITGQKEAQRRRDLTSALLALFAHKSTASDYLNSVVDAIRQWTGCQALGIRILDEQKRIPYESWAGFDPAFLELESCLSLDRDNCCCIRAISGAYEEQDRASLTPGGSYRSDDAIALLNQLPPEKQSRYRGNCMKFGFASLAVIPVRYRQQSVGAVHLADRRAGQFPLATVELLESLAPLIGEAVHRFQTEAELARHRDYLEVLVQERTRELQAANTRLQSEIVERKAAQESLEQTSANLERSNRDLEQFAYIASHDLQEPLRAVGGYVTLLKRRIPEALDPKALEFVAGAADGASRMERMITDLLAFSRVHTHSGPRMTSDLNVLLREALLNLQTSVAKARARITNDPLPTLPVDATQIMQLLQNLIGNAIKFKGDRPPEIHVGAQKLEDRWVLSVRDNGIGIEPQYFDRIFQIFQRLHTRAQYPGTGIGLAICKRIVERHGGAIWIESQPGQGSSFYFSIPDTA